MNELNAKYKNRHKPIQNSEKLKFHQGYYNPQNPEKWLTKQVIYRSSWEFFFCKWADENPQVLKVASEPIGVKYLNPILNMKYCMESGLDPNYPGNWKECTYYTDFWIEVEDAEKPDGKKRIFIEIKPYDQTQCPKPINENASLKEHKAFNKAAETFLVNQQKWAAAKKYFEERGAEFMVLTERTLEKMGMNAKY